MSAEATSIDVDALDREKREAVQAVEESREKTTCPSCPSCQHSLEDDGSFQLWAFDYSKKCQTKEPPEDFFKGFETALAAIRALAYDTFHVETADPEEIDTDAQPTATGLGDFA